MRTEKNCYFTLRRENSTLRSLKCSGFSYFSCLLSRLINIFHIVFHHSRFRLQPVWLGCISYPIVLRLKNSFETYFTWDHIFRLDGRTFFDD